MSSVIQALLQINNCFPAYTQIPWIISFRFLINSKALFEYSFLSYSETYVTYSSDSTAEHNRLYKDTASPTLENRELNDEMNELRDNKIKSVVRSFLESAGYPLEDLEHVCIDAVFCVEIAGRCSDCNNELSFG